MPREDLIQVRRGTSVQWAAVNPVLDLAEPGLDTTLARVKHGDGVTQWLDLPWSDGPLVDDSTTAGWVATEGTESRAAVEEVAAGVASTVVASELEGPLSAVEGRAAEYTDETVGTAVSGEVTRADGAYAPKALVETGRLSTAGVQDTIGDELARPGSPAALTLSAAYATGGEVRSKAKADGTNEAALINAEVAALAAFGRGTVLLPSGVIRADAPIVPQQQVALRGTGKGGTRIEANHTGPAIAAEFPINTSSNPQRLLIQDMTIRRAGSATTGVGLSLVGLALVSVERVHFIGFEHQLVMQQVTHGHVTDCIFENFSKTGVWLANGGDYKPGGAITPPYNNHLTVKDNLILSSVAGSHGVVDDGGWNHEVSNNSFERCTVQLRVAGVTAFRAANNEHEAGLSGGASVEISNLTRAGTNVGPGSLTFDDSVLDSPSAYDCIKITGSVTSLAMRHYVMYSTATAVKGMSNVQRFYGIGNRNDGGGALLDGRATVSHTEFGAATASIGGTFTSPIKWAPPADAAATALDLAHSFGVGRADFSTASAAELLAPTGGRWRFKYGAVVSGQFAEKYWLPPAVATADRPAASAVPGAIYKDTTLNRLVESDGTTWHGLARRLAIQATVDCPSIPAHSTVGVDVSFAGAAVGDAVVVAAPAALEAGLIVTARVTATDQVNIRFGNVTTAAIDPASGSWRLAILK